MLAAGRSGPAAGQIALLARGLQIRGRSLAASLGAGKSGRTLGQAHPLTGPSGSRGSPLVSGADDHIGSWPDLLREAALRARGMRAEARPVPDALPVAAAFDGCLMRAVPDRNAAGRIHSRLDRGHRSNSTRGQPKAVTVRYDEQSRPRECRPWRLGHTGRPHRLAEHLWTLSRYT